MSPELIDAILAGDWAAAERMLEAPIPPEWRSAGWNWLARRSSEARADPAAVRWFPRVMLLRPPGATDATVVGHVGFHGPPDREGRVEIGYTVVSAHRRRGFAEEAVRALLEWCWADHGVRAFRASVGPWNEPSLRLIRKLGFVQVGTQWDEEDGEELVFHLDGEPAPPPGAGGRARRGRVVPGIS